MQSENKSLREYKNKKAIYILKSIIKEFIKEFHKNLTQRHNGAIALVRKLEKKYIIYRVYALAR